MHFLPARPTRLRKQPPMADSEECRQSAGRLKSVPEPHWAFQAIKKDGLPQPSPSSTHRDPHHGKTRFMYPAEPFCLRRHRECVGLETVLEGKSVHCQRTANPIGLMVMPSAMEPVRSTWLKTPTRCSPGSTWRASQQPSTSAPTTRAMSASSLGEVIAAFRLKPA